MNFSTSDRNTRNNLFSTSSDRSTLFSNGSNGEVIWLNVKQKNIKIEILNELNETQRVLDLLPNQGIKVPAKGSIRRVLY